MTMHNYDPVLLRRLLDAADLQEREPSPAHRLAVAAAFAALRGLPAPDLSTVADACELAHSIAAAEANADRAAVLAKAKAEREAAAARRAREIRSQLPYVDPSKAPALRRELARQYAIAGGGDGSVGDVEAVIAAALDQLDRESRN